MSNQNVEREIAKNVKAMTRTELVAELKREDRGVWRATSSGYGASASLFWLSEEGLSDCGCETTPPIDGPHSLTQEDISEIQAEIQQGRGDDDDELVLMVKAGCKADKEYWRIDPSLAPDEENEWYDTEDAAEEAAADYVWVETVDTESWDEMSTDDLRRWCEVALLMDQGLGSEYELGG